MLFIVVEDDATADLFIKSLNKLKYERVYKIAVNGKNTIGSYARTVRLNANEEGKKYRVLVVFNADGLSGKWLNIHVSELEYACYTNSQSREMRVFGYSPSDPESSISKMQEFLDM